MLRIMNGKVVTPERVIEKGSVLIENGKIIDVASGAVDTYGVQTIDAGGRYISPGFVDMHVHGGGGRNFDEPDPRAYITAARTHLLHGTTTIIPTLIIRGAADFESCLDAFLLSKQNAVDMPSMPGLHIEGPYINSSQKGAFSDKYIKPFNRQEYLAILKHSQHILNWTAAPELPGGLEFGRELYQRGILASVGHSDALHEQVAEAFENGFRNITHLYSATSTVRRINAYRFAGVVESAYLIKDIHAELICDGSHLPASLLRLAYQIKGAERLCLVTDAMEGAGLSPDEYSKLGPERIKGTIIEDGVAKLADRSSFAGSIATTDMLLRNMVKLGGAPVVDAVRMLTSTPAGLLGIGNRKGRLSRGMDADVVLFDNDMQISGIIAGGRPIMLK